MTVPYVPLLLVDRAPSPPLDRCISLGGAAVLAAAGVFRPALAADEQTVAEAVEAFRQAMIAGDHAAFDALCAAQLSYGHSTVKITPLQYRT